jgi:putative Mn2+ efflux pump MntP
MHQVGSAGVATRLFGVRDLALGMALHHPSADVRKAAVEAGIAIDVLDVAASVIGRRAGAPAASLAGVAAGATLFVVLGVTIIADSAAS